MKKYHIDCKHTIWVRHFFNAVDDADAINQTMNSENIDIYDDIILLEDTLEAMTRAENQDQPVCELFNAVENNGDHNAILSL